MQKKKSVATTISYSNHTLYTHELLPSHLSTQINPLHPNISINILHTVLCTFSKVLKRRICLTIKSFRVPQVSNHILDQNILQTPLGFELVNLQYHTFNLSNPGLLFFLFFICYNPWSKRPKDNLQRSSKPHIKTDHLGANINTPRIINSRNVFMKRKNT